MTIASELQALQTNLDNSYTAVNSKGGTLPAAQNFDNLATAISSIPTGGSTPTLITKNITANGTYNASSDNADGYSSVAVNVSGGSSTKYGLSLDELLGDTNANGVLQAPVGDINLVFTGVTDIAANGLKSAFYTNQKIKTVSFPDLTILSGSDALYQSFYSNTNLTSVNFQNLTSISADTAMDSAFYNCDLITTISFPNLISITGANGMYRAFRGCSKITTADFPNLQVIGQNAATVNHRHFNYTFNGCSLLKTLTFPKLEKIYCTGSSSSYGTFGSNTSLQKIYFPKLDTITYGSGASSSNQNACKYIFNGCSALTEIHFAATNQAAIEATAGYSTKWGATNATIYFDL